MRINKKYVSLVKIILLLLIAVLSILSLEMGNHNEKILALRYMYINVGTLFFFIIMISILFRKLWFSALISTLLIHILAIANYYVIIYRGVPISFDDVFNIGTAANVMDGYILTIDKQVCCIVICLLLSIGIIFLLCQLEKSSCMKSFMKSLVAICCTVTFIFTGYIMNDSIKPHNTLSWSWKESYYKYGYLASTIEAFSISLKPVRMPENYDESALQQYAERYEIGVNTNEEYPDIILILNETWYDLQKVIDITTDIPYMSFYNSLDNAIKGNVVVAASGGGTNKSEYELLTSNSVYLTSGGTPFNILDLTNANNITSFLNELGFYTVGAHSEPPENYGRGKAYRKLGFDETYFAGDFSNLEYYQNRWYETDSSLYNNLFSIYNSMPSDQSRFIYLLTIQNHGGWDLNDSTADIVHVQEDYGNYTEQINEYLTCIYQSDLALKELIEYYQNVARPVIICMVGDHSPAFVNDLVINDNLETTKQLHSTPFLIWANYSIEERDLEYIGMNALIPNLLEVAGMPLSPYYQYILNMQEFVPVLTAFDVYINRDGEFYNYNDSSEYSEMVNLYYYMEYNNIGKNSNRYQKLFDPNIN